MFGYLLAVDVVIWSLCTSKSLHEWAMQLSCAEIWASQLQLLCLSNESIPCTWKGKCSDWSELIILCAETHYICFYTAEYKGPLVSGGTPAESFLHSVISLTILRHCLVTRTYLECLPYIKSYGKVRMSNLSQNESSLIMHCWISGIRWEKPDLAMQVNGSRSQDSMSDICWLLQHSGDQ